ncbi:MAG: phosphotransferase [Deltaproteobacteria bacterium]|nr:phosphotransferase [Deltaproteobacteria bacterium]
MPDLSPWGLDSATLRPVTDGLINQTWIVERPEGPAGVLQRLNTAIFRPEVHYDLLAVTEHLAAKGLPTPRLIPTLSGALWHQDGEGVFRLLTLIGDATHHTLADPAMARSAGALLGRFHAALSDLEWSFRHVRGGVHDTPAHMAALEQTLSRQGDHRLYDQVAPLAAEALAAWERLPPTGALPPRALHGDPKLSNLRFLRGEAHALIDLDTLARGTLDAELGDALRSWCNRATEDQEARLDLDLLRAALAGYAEAAELTAGEWDAIPTGLERICWELTARFAADALDEVRFGWAPRYGSRGAHNLARARGQASLARAVGKARAEMYGVIAALTGR